MDGNVNASDVAGLDPGEDMVAASTTCRGEDHYAKGYRLTWERIKKFEGTAVDAGKNAENITQKVVPDKKLNGYEK